MMIGGTRVKSSSSLQDLRPASRSDRQGKTRCLLQVHRRLLCAALICAAVTVSAQHDAVPGMAADRMPAWQRFNYSRWPYDLPPAVGDRERDGEAPWHPPAVAQSGNDRREDLPPHCRASCIIGTIKPEPTGNKLAETTGVATPLLSVFRPLPSAPAADPRPPASSPPVAFVIDRRSLLAGQIWFAVAVLLLCAMTFVSVAVVVSFFALAGLIAGMSLLVDFTWQYQVSIFALLGVAAVALWGRLDAARSPDPPLNNRGPDSLVGRVFQLEKPIVGGNGMLTCDGIFWRITGHACAAGKRVKVLRADGTLLSVEPVEG
jgi:inner membrane protein